MSIDSFGKAPTQSEENSQHSRDTAFSRSSGQARHKASTGTYTSQTSDSDRVEITVSTAWIHHPDRRILAPQTLVALASYDGKWNSRYTRSTQSFLGDMSIFPVYSMHLTSRHLTITKFIIKLQYRSVWNTRMFHCRLELQPPPSHVGVRVRLAAGTTVVGVDTSGGFRSSTSTVWFGRKSQCSHKCVAHLMRVTFTLCVHCLSQPWWAFFWLMKQQQRLHTPPLHHHPKANCLPLHLWLFEPVGSFA